ncbi:hypothetical protein A2715_01940 [Candidatus Woesebacteria bacterium RIFCSPHIGHO2_01_FULL_39_32]|uniref:Carboxyl-terminal protease n=2 Tax=Candidatus Woeseibacteriota TaxID=1752722 RepID=A0A0G0SZ07_9BACT|nr:MAG: Carboxyl-terminal protease [Candidatus Woesebacteria bacterium GW2011_GWA1_39_8]OGM03869.1 MAG: hypothetical protein A2124_04555 [Candidatus Woesebacteria bacterium GWB1_37_5]OGM23918.1 MAG: hypothetical protein A2715_01940 [Candidatus Woesebacteria bacterium RIFCSPHIGHO2_01_FULL_39_32]OGM37425.1 MAG: hypothetical protein A3F01_03175 [Candidatus Woesebacteria bacterium RIFCSPHIGHO2_12_FULL_38_11]OGM64107.1 MAG: hypothetical protein A2893_03180 [Candidatus Woesebacteria bacterium RIFCSPL
MLKVNFSIVRKILLLSFLVAVSFAGGYFFGYKGFRASVQKFPDVTIDRVVPQDKDSIDFALFWRVWDTLSAKYYDPDKIIPSEMVYGAIRGMVSAVGDPYTVFLPPAENKVVQEDLQGTFEGIGIQIGFKGSQLAVIAPLPESPAEKAGVQAGDFIIGIKDETKNIDMGTVGITVPEAVEAIRGRAGTKVSLLLLRDGQSEADEVEIVRESINVPSIVVDYISENGRLAHIKVIKFSGETTAEWEDALVELVTKPNIEGIILDVRNNPGGYLDKAIEIASDFLENGDTVVKEEGADEFENVYRVEKIGRLRKQKMVVLINEGSASASEILAGALKDNKRAKLIGTTTFGKGTIQEPLPVDGGAGLHVTIARWLTPGGFWVNDGGLKPDIEVEDNSDTEEDEQLQKAIEEMNS